MIFPPRPILHERPVYEPHFPSEQFIVPLLQQKIEQALATYAAPAPREGRVLDIGCGRQPFRQRLESFGYTYTSLDTQQNLEETVDVVCAIDEALPEVVSRRGPYQFIFCTEVLEHVADWNIAFKNIASLLAPNGRVLITCPHFYQLHEAPYDFWRPTLHALEFYAWREGLKTLHKEAAGDAWDVLGTLLPNIKPIPSNPHLLARLAARVFFWSKNALWDALSKRQIQNFVQLKSPFYLSNVVIFERQ